MTDQLVCSHVGSSGVNMAESRQRLGPVAFPRGQERVFEGVLKALFERLFWTGSRQGSRHCLGQCLPCVVVHSPFYWHVARSLESMSAFLGVKIV